MTRYVGLVIGGALVSVVGVLTLLPVMFAVVGSFNAAGGARFLGEGLLGGRGIED